MFVLYVLFGKGGSIACWNDIAGLRLHYARNVNYFVVRERGKMRLAFRLNDLGEGI